MNERLDRFTKLLKEIFELDKSDLDFGIYRVMNLRKAQIEQFLTERLPKMVQETLAPFAQGSKEEIRAKMKQIEESVAEMGMTVDALPNTAQKKQQYLQLQKQLAEGADLAALETDVYSALYSFFNRYYEDGDFISKRRYKEGVYAIPYEGEEVKLYWANQDQYYIKTSENFKDYTFVFDGINVHFRLVDATTEQNNNKESKDNKRAFMLFREDEEIYPGIKTFEYDPDTAEIVIRFVYDIPEDKKKKYTEENYARITEWLLSQRRAELNPLIAPIPTGKGRETTTLLEKHLKGYVAKNTFDYFIHKDLHGFLTRELDFFIKSEVMHLEDLDTGSEARVETYLAKVKAVKRVGKIIIDFLAQIENFQKKLWLKKKFVVETNWCVTLDKIDESFWPEIIGNKAQIDEWIVMYAIDEAEGWTNPPSGDFLHQNQNLIIDTKHFSNTFKYALLESIPNLDEQTDGLMINGDNYHALNFLQSRYSASIDVAYIDPPYNTDASEILYKNNYKHSSFLTMMDNRLTMAYDLLSDQSMISVAIDDAELDRLIPLMDSIFPKNAGETRFVKGILGHGIHNYVFGCFLEYPHPGFYSREACWQCSKPLYLLYLSQLGHQFHISLSSFLIKKPFSREGCRRFKCANASVGELCIFRITDRSYAKSSLGYASITLWTAFFHSSGLISARWCSGRYSYISHFSVEKAAESSSAFSCFPSSPLTVIGELNLVRVFPSVYSIQRGMIGFPVCFAMSIMPQ